jgi:hypothetical protein
MQLPWKYSIRPKLCLLWQRKQNVKFDEELVTEAELHLRQFFEDRVHTRFAEHQLFITDRLGSGYSHDESRYQGIRSLDGVSNFLAVPIGECRWPFG